MTEDPEPPLVCPSAQPDWPDATAIGVVGGDAHQPVVGYLARPVPVTTQLLQLTAPVRPAEVFRFAAPCIQTRCQHFGTSCNLAAKVVELLPEHTDALPPCHIRARCRWYREQGPPACARCPLVTTHDANPSDAVRRAADPSVRPGADPAGEEPR